MSIHYLAKNLVLQKYEVSDLYHWSVSQLVLSSTVGHRWMSLEAVPQVTVKWCFAVICK